MARLEIHREERGGRIVLRLEGTLDSRTALLLRHSLEELSTQEVLVDFAHLREFRDTAVGVLTHSLLERKVHLRGLDEHHQRVLRYFGVPTDFTARAWYTPEEVASA